MVIEEGLGSSATSTSAVKAQPELGSDPAAREELDGEKWIAEDERRGPEGTQEPSRRPAAGRANHVFLSRWSIMTRLVLDWLAFTLVRTRGRRWSFGDARSNRGSTPQTDWRKNRQFLDLLARSGSALFVSVDPATRTPDVEEDLLSALRMALDGGVPGGIEPLDWLQTTAPERWRSGDELVVLTGWTLSAPICSSGPSTTYDGGTHRSATTATTSHSRPVEGLHR